LRFSIIAGAPRFRLSLSLGIAQDTPSPTLTTGAVSVTRKRRAASAVCAETVGQAAWPCRAWTDQVGWSASLPCSRAARTTSER